MNFSSGNSIQLDLDRSQNLTVIYADECTCGVMYDHFYALSRNRRRKHVDERLTLLARNYEQLDISLNSKLTGLKFHVFP